MKKRLFAAFVSLCMIVSMLPTMAFAEAGAQDSNKVADTTGLCEHHTQHDSACGYTEGTAEIPCSHEHTEDCYTLVTECVHEHTAECYSDGILPVDGEEKTADSCSHVCSEESGCITKTLDCKHQHDEACGYVPATEGTPCTFVCEVCNVQDSGNTEDSSDAQPEECTCETLCTEEEVNGDCPVCSAEGAELDKVCIGAAPMLAAAAPLSSEHFGHDGWKTLSGTIEELELPSGNYVLTGDVTLGNSLWCDESVTICLNGYKINGNTMQRLRDSTICDCTGRGYIYDTEVRDSSLSNVNLDNCVITGSATIDGNTTIYAGCTINVYASYNMTINSNTTITSGVEIRLTDFGILSFNGANVQSMINMNSGTCNISGTTEIKNFTEGAPAVNVRGGTCNITGGTISSPIVMTEGTCNITGGTIKVYDYTSPGENTGAVVVKGGTCNIGGDAQITGNRIDNGGAVSVLGGNCTISGSNIYGNNTKYGGVYVENGTCTIEKNAYITGNQAFDQGGGVYVAGGVCDIYGTIGSNYTAYNYDGDGGGVYVAGGECNIYGTIYNNTAKRDGGGVYVADGKCDIAATSINYNEAAGNGGGIYVAGGECRIATQTIGLNTATGNGGGVYVASGAKVTVNNTQAGPPRITHNTANGNGGGVYLCEGVEWNNLCYVTTNTAQYGGGIYSEGDCKLTIRNGSVEGNTATVEGGGLYLKDSQTKPCIVEITNWTIKDNKDNSSRPNNMVSLNSQITYEQGLSTQDTLPYEEPGSIILRDSASFTIMSGKYKASEISSCFTRQSDNKILIAGGYYDADPSKEPTLTVVDGVKAIELDGDVGYNQYDPNYPWAVYPVKDGIMSGTSNNPVYNGAPIEQDSGFSLSGATDIQKFYYLHKSQGAEDSTYISGLPSDAGDYTIKVGGLHLRTIGKEYYTECTFDLTIAKADPSYTVPAGITAQVGKPLSNVTLPEGWAWKDGSTIPEAEGTQTYPAIFTPDDTANYNTVETDISVEVEHAHKGVLIEEVPATCTQTGVKAYYECSICQKYFEDEACNKPITDLDSWKVIPSLGHDFGGWTSNENGTHTGTCQRDGCDATDTQNCSGGEATYFLKAECEICGGAYGELKKDTTLPTGEISVKENRWNKFLNTITFGLFFKETQSIVITADDDSYSVAGYTDDKAAVIEYYLYDGDTALSQEELEDKEFTTYTGSLNMEPNGKYTIYVRITDHAGNKTYISSDGIVMYTDAKQDTESISFVKTTTEDVTASVFTNGNTVKEIRNGATVLSDSDYGVSYEGNKATITFKAAYLDTLTAGGYTLTLSYNPLGMEYQDGDGSEAPSNTTITLTVNQQAGTITNISDISKIYDDTAVSAPTYDSLSTGTAVIEYKVKDADDSTYTQTAPNTVGEYTVRITVAADGNYAEASATRDFTISYLTAPQEPYTLIGSAGTNGWYTGDVTLKPADGYTVSTTLNGTYSDQLDFAQTTEGFTIYLKNSVGQMTDAITVGTIKIDKTAPDGDILFEKNSVKEFINNISFGLFFNKDIDVEITCTDDLSGVAKIEYYRSDKALTEAEVAAITDWMETNGKFSVTAEDQVNFIYYVKITDQAGNQTYFGSDGATFDTTKPVIKGITDGKIYCEEQTFTVEETNLESVLIDGVAATPDNTGNYTLPAGNKQYTITVTDKAGNNTLCTVTVNDGHDWNEAIYTWNDDGSSCTASRTCKNDSDHVETAEANITSKPGKEPTCTENGETSYTATFTVEWASEQSKTIADVPALGHKLTKTEANAPTCTEDGNKEYWTCDTCGKYFSDANGDTEIEKDSWIISAIGHDWNDAVYTWSDDGSTCTATRTCKNDSAHTETSKATVTGAQTKAPTCTENGETTYTATFEADWAMTQTKVLADIPATGHSYGKPEWSWSEDGKTCTVIFTCEKDETHKETPEVKVTSAVKTAATCTETGVTTYTATVEFNGQTHTDTKDVADIPATNHSYGEPEWNWSEDGKTCTVTFTCANDETHKETPEVKVTSAVKTPATCTEKGVTTYTAAVEFNGKTYTDTKDLTDIPATGHSYGKPEWNWSEDGKTCTVTFTCANDKTHKETPEVKVASEVKTPATCTEAGVTTYTATVEFNGKTYTDTKDLTDIPATGHSYDNGKCTVCGAIASDFKVIITAGANGSWQKGTKDGLTFTSNAAYKHFQKVQVDGKDLDASNYTVKEGSTIVTLKDSYLETLSVGKHTLSIVSDTGTATTEFTIKAAASANNQKPLKATNITKGEATESVQTGDNTNMMLWIVLLIISASALGITAYGIRKKHTEK